MQFLLATRNPGKINEMRQLLAEAEIGIVGLSDANLDTEIEETGSSFAENARIKAVGYALRSGMHAIADDSGLEVTALGGRPGVFSARYAGAKSSYDVKIATLLSEIKRSDSDDRTARFASHIAVADPRGNVIQEAQGICKGKIAREPRGSNGFGYDPVFIPEGFALTFGELGSDVKQTISHRSLAISKIIRFLRDFA